MRPEKMRWKLTVLIIFTVGLVLSVLIRLLWVQTPPPVKQLTLNTSAPLNVKKINKLDLQWQIIVVTHGDTLAAIFSRLKINQEDLVQLLKQNKFLAVLRPHEKLAFQTNSSHQLMALQYPLSTAKTLIFIRQGNDFIKKMKTQPVTTTLTYKSIVIQHSIIQDAKKSGLTSRMLSELQTIFGGKINFARDLRRGDRFDFLYQEDYINGKKYRNGNILAAEFIHRGKIEQAVRYTYPIDHTAYYNPNGRRSVEAHFLRAPLDYKRISSYFSYHRYDPVLHKVRPHLGVDFAAPLGTPIKSIAEGQIVFMGHDGGYGRTIKVDYGHHYLALYGHMLGFAKLHLNEWVHKGEIIGYVGESGWTTGPHLHFGFYVNGKPQNWLAMKLPTDQSVPQKYEKPFLNTAKELLAELYLHQDTQLAANNTKLKNST
ncbi:peptidoglycan DD-metalloendopeptidase family protein [Candidatus Coxiella mudrowiae]|uniref:Peptidoglycan-specific endopeptidase, M23 family n=1 Tax=Candidatus Coxiella mudrowiae TaxID=2054173 RepID=A0ABN4HV43_9COXI|nr:peptidoglycan DD-metalloendopeptidase family protein [Candidatus Coxiella mudrowiae]AKQ33943.1 Peptidoglycan-specific endopeptidase, M23 family [Candidatus Coxiella mudrowiae]